MNKKEIEHIARWLDQSNRDYIVILLGLTKTPVLEYDFFKTHLISFVDFNYIALSATELFIPVGENVCTKEWVENTYGVSSKSCKWKLTKDGIAVKAELKKMGWYLE